jgi:hypothetical protein
MPTPTYTALATVTLASTATSITFSSIPATYRDLVLVVTGKATATAALRVRVNGDTGNNYSYIRLGGEAPGAFSDSSTTNFMDIGGQLNTNEGFHSINQFLDYSATDKHKTALHRIALAATAYVGINGSRWANTAAITSIQVYNPTLAVGFTASLYGIVS